jgi:hypothetical protein
VEPRPTRVRPADCDWKVVVSRAGNTDGDFADSTVQIRIDGSRILRGHASQRLIDRLARGSPLFDRVRATGLDHAPAPLQIRLDLLLQGLRHGLQAIDQLRRQLVAGDPALLGPIAMVAPVFEVRVLGLQPALLAAEGEEPRPHPRARGFRVPVQRRLQSIPKAKRKDRQGPPGGIRMQQTFTHTTWRVIV